MPAGMQCGKIPVAIDTGNHRFAIDDELTLVVAEGRFNDPWIPARPIVAASGEQPNPAAIPLHDHAKAVVLHLMDPVGCEGTLVLGRDAGSEKIEA